MENAMNPGMTPSLKTGVGNIRSNVEVLMQPPISRPRKKAISTIARINNITRNDAQFRQARHIAEYYAKKNQ